MKKHIICLIFFFFIITSQSLIYAAVTSSNVRDVVKKMQRDLSLTEEQVEAVKPIVKKNLQARQDVIDTNNEDLFANKKAIKSLMLLLRQEEEKELSKVLSPEQMRKFIEKRQFKDSLNKDKVDFSEGLDNNSMSIEGPRMAF